MFYLLLTSCALLALTTPAELSDPRAGVAPCHPGPWSVSCPACTPPWSRAVVVTCVGEGPVTWEEDMTEAALGPDGGLGAVRSARPGEDWTITTTETTP